MKNADFINNLTNSDLSDENIDPYDTWFGQEYLCPKKLKPIPAKESHSDDDLFQILTSMPMDCAGT
jgi:uncharacterized protein YukJ